MIMGWCRLRCWDDPAGLFAGDPTSSSVFQPWDEPHPAMVREVTWRRNHDWDRFHDWSDAPSEPFDSRPTLCFRRANVPIEALRELLGRAATIRVPLAALRDSLSVTCDVGSCGMEIFSADAPPAILSFQWAWDVPDTWKPFAEWAGELNNLLKGLVWT